MADIVPPSTVTDEDVPLFAGYEPPPAPKPEDELSAQQRITRRQYADIQYGKHPLTHGPLHPEASRQTDGPHPRRAPFTCGGCTHLEGNGWGYLKCYLPGPDGKPMPQRMTHGPQTDARRWWPACPDYARSEDVDAE